MALNIPIFEYSLTEYSLDNCKLYLPQISKVPLKITAHFQARKFFKNNPQDFSLRGHLCVN